MKKRILCIITIIVGVIMVLTGCKSVSSDAISSAEEAGNQAAVISATSEIIVDTDFTARDLEVGYEESTATQIVFEGANIEVDGDGASVKDTVLTISKEGTYVVSGTLDNGQIVVDTGDEDKVQIVLNGVNITCGDNAPVYIKNADKVFITLEENTINYLTDGTEYIQTDDDNTVDAVIYSKADLTINGGGTLNITANYKHGIVSKDDLVITGGTFYITAVKDAINGKDCVKIKDGIFTLSASTGNGIQSKNGEDTTKGYVYISGGSITVLSCQEGIEGTAIVIEDGIIDIVATDDGLNASSGDSTSEDSSASNTETNAMMKGGFGSNENPFEIDTNCYVSISGGSITVNAAGDGIDSNGSLYISGGRLYISGPTESMNGALDYTGTAEITGGTVVIAGSVGMAQGFSDTSSQYSLLYNFTSVCAAGTEIILTDQEGNVVVSFTPDKQYQSVVISSPKLADNETYTLTCGNQTADITLTSVVTSNGQQGVTGQTGMGGRRGMDRGRFEQGNMSDFNEEIPENGELPENEE